MVRYAKQDDSYSCGPTSIINALKHFGVPTSYREEKKYVSLLCNCQLDGTGVRDFDRALRSIGQAQWAFNVLHKTKLSIAQIEAHLHAGRIIVIQFFWEKNDGLHNALITKCSKNGKYFYLANALGGKNIKAVRRFTRENFKKQILRFRSEVRYWILRNWNDANESWKNI